MAEIEGLTALQRRIHAVSTPTGVMRALGLATVREAKLLVHRKTGNLGRSIHLDRVTETSARVVASANYAGFVEHGTRAHTITPQAAKALRFAVGGNRRLSGAPRSGAPVVFAKVVHHPGSKPYPFLVPGAKRAVGQSGLHDLIVREWNDAG
jgi:hypothetical protein